MDEDVYPECSMQEIIIMTVENIRMPGRFHGNFRLGLVLSTTWSVYSRHAPKFLTISLLTEASSISAFFVAPLSQAAYFTTTKGLAITLASILLTYFGGAVAAYGVYEDLRGNNFGIGKAFRMAGGSFIPVLVASILTTIATALGSLAFIIPGLMIACRYYIVVPACVSERLGPIESMRRSAGLTEGHRWPIFGLVVLVAIAYALPDWLPLYQLGVSTSYYTTISIVEMAYQVFVTSLAAMIPAVVYFQLRLEKEGVDISQLTTVFD